MSKFEVKYHKRPNHMYSSPQHIFLASYINPFKPSDAKWLHFKVFKAILV